MSISGRIMLPVLLVGAIALAGGCSSDLPDKDIKDRDRTMIQLGIAENQRDQYKVQLDKAQADLAGSLNLTDDSTQVGLLKKQVQDLQESVTNLTNENAKLKEQLANATHPAGK